VNVVLLNTYDAQGGAAIATSRLHRGLRAIGVNSRLLVQIKRSDDTYVLAPSNFLAKALAIFSCYWEIGLKKLYRLRKEIFFSPAWLSFGVISRADAHKPDIVHLFWINGGFVNPETIKKFNKPLVWTLHDMWPFTGGCHYDDECGGFTLSCGKCPQLDSNIEHDLSRRVWNRKQKSWGGVPITVVATSRWLASMARASSLFSSYRIEVIPNGLDTEKYRPLDKRACRAAYDLPLDKQLILFSAFRATADKRKGNHLLLEALAILAKDKFGEQAELVIVGASEPEVPLDLRMKVHYLGNLHDEISQVLLYSAADVTVAPSMQENLSNTVMESLACGTPVVAFDIGGMPDLIDHQKGGYLAQPFSSTDLANGIIWVLESSTRKVLLDQYARDSAVEKYSLKTIANRYLALYLDIVK
jgi:glycosyltransferase involved in cell wall biosynthesis